MNFLLRKLRGLLGVGITWFVGWAMITFLFGTILTVADPDSIDPGEEPWRISLIVGTLGFISGAAFALIFSSVERRRTIRQLSTWRSALWGALGGAALPLLSGLNDALLIMTVPLGAIFAASTVAVARRAALREPESVEELPLDQETPRLPA